MEPPTGGSSPAREAHATIRPMHRHAGRRRPPRRLATLVAAFSLLAAACGTSGPTASPPANPSPTPTATPSSAPASAGPISSADAAAVYATIEDQVVAIRGLQPKAKVDPKAPRRRRDQEAHRRLVREGQPAGHRGRERADHEGSRAAAGRRVADRPVRKPPRQPGRRPLRPGRQDLYVVSRTGAIGVVEKSTFSHEYTHALQDQNFDLGSLKLDEIGQGDRSFARLALVEGDATLSMSYWQIQHLSQAELGRAHRQRQRTILRRGPPGHAADPPRVAPVPVPPGPDVRPGAPGQRRLAGGRRRVRPTRRPRPSRSSIRRSTRPERAADRRVTSRPISPRVSGRLEGRPPGHVR